MNEAELLAEVLARPDDDAPRLMYADWLEERADPRGEYIRVQCERSALAHSDARREALLKREHELFAQHGRQWAAELGPAVQWLEFRRGFVEALGTSADALLTHASRWFSLAPIRQLELIGSLTRAESKWAALSCLARLDGLTFRENAGFHAFAKVLAGLSSLRGLQSLSIDTTLSPAVVRTLAHSPNLAGLKRLRLEGAFLDDDCVQAIALSMHWRGLTELSLAGNIQITAQGAGALATSPFLTQLESLSMADTSAGNGASGYFAFSPNLRRLKALDLSGALDGGPEAVMPIADSPNLPLLESLAIARCNLGDDGVAALSQSRRLESLRVLDLAENAITDQGLDRLAQWPRLTQLVDMNICDNLFSAAGWARFLKGPLSPSKCRLVGRRSATPRSSRAKLEDVFPGRFWLDQRSGGRRNDT